MLRNLVLASAIMLAACSASRISNEPPPVGVAEGPSDAERTACQTDVTKYCKADIADTMRVVGCLQKNRKKISPACRGVLTNHGL